VETQELGARRDEPTFWRKARLSAVRGSATEGLQRIQAGDQEGLRQKWAGIDRGAMHQPPRHLGRSPPTLVLDYKIPRPYAPKAFGTNLSNQAQGAACFASTLEVVEVFIIS